MGSEGRWIKLYMMDYDEVYHDSKMFHLWIDILLHTNPVDYYHHGDLIKRGQCILSLNQVAERCHMSKHTVKKYLALLEECGKIELDIQRKGTKVTVLNWYKYQSSGAVGGAKVHQEVHQEVHREVHQEVHQEVHRNKNKRIKEEKRLSVIDSDLSDLKSYLIENDFEDVADEVIEICERYGLKKITNLNSFALAVAKEKKAKKAIPITEKKKAHRKVTEEDKEELRRLTEGLGGDL